MMPEEWPIAAGAADQNAPARPAGRGRLSTVRVDFFLDPAERLTEQERALMTVMLHCVVGEVADELRAGLPSALAPANDEDHGELIERMSRARLFDDPGLIALLLRRADEERIAAAARTRSGRRDARLIQGLVSHGDGNVSAAAMALILARGRRRDRFGQCLVAIEDLPRSSAEQLVHAVAAATRPKIAAAHGTATVDAELTSAAKQLLSIRASDRSLDALTAELARTLDESGALSDDLLVAAAQEGEAAFLAAALGRRCGVPIDLVMDELQSAEPTRVIALLRMSRVSHDACAGLLASIGDLLGLGDPGEALSVFERMTESEVDAARAWLATSDSYRDALDRLGSNHG